MARSAGLNAARLAALALVVLLGHGLGLDWLASQWPSPVAQRPLATPMYTRQILPDTPPAPVGKQKPTPAPVQRARKAINSIASKATPAAAPTPAASDATTPEATATASATPLTPAASAPNGGLPDATTASAAPAATTSTTASTSLDSWPADTRVTYQLGGHFRGELHGDARVQWQREADRYQARIELDIGWLVSASMTSQGRVTPQGLAPGAYEEHVRGRRRGLVLGERGIALDNGQQVARPEGVQDSASQLVELAHQFASGRAQLEVGRPVSVWLARPGGVDLWTYDVVEQVTLATPRLGPVEAFHLKPRPLANPRGSIVAELWFAPRLQYLPVRIRISLGGDTFVDLLVETIEQR